MDKKNQINSSEDSQKIIIGSVNILGGTVFSNLLGGIRGFVIASVLGPSLYGIWNILMVIFSYNSYVHLGLLDGMNKKMPYLRGKLEFDQAEKVKDNTFWAVLIITVLANLILILVSHIFQDAFPIEISVAIYILAVTNILFQLFVYLHSLLRTDKKFGLISFSTILFSLASLIFVLLFFQLFKNKLYGALLAILLGYFIANASIISRVRYKIEPTMTFSLILGIFKIGLPIIIIQIGYVLFISIDRWMIVAMIGQIDLGYYGIGITMATFLHAAASTVAFTLYPFMLEKHGETRDAKMSEQFVYTPVIVVSYFMSIICTLSAFVVPLLLTYLLPAYNPGIHASEILVFSAYFISTMLISVNFLISIDKQNYILILQCFIIPISIMLNYIFIKLGLGIKGVALGTGVVYFCYATGISVLAFQSFSNNLKDLILKIINIYLPFLLCLLSYFCLKAVFTDIHVSFRRDLFVTAVQILIFGGFSILLAIHLNNITGLIKLLQTIFASMFKRNVIENKL